ncbi:MAG: response regulator [Spirochaetales bacterium]|nr:response regulator [Spirochaetales bacterium]
MANKAVLSLFTLLLFSCSSLTLPLSAVKAQVNLEDINLSAKTALLGEWEFYPFQFLCSSDFTNNKNLEKIYCKVPQPWNGLKSKNKQLDGIGYGTYRLKLESTIEEKAALQIEYLNTAYRLYFNDDLIMEVGIPAETALKAKPYISPKYGEISIKKGNNDIIIQISNYHDVLGGFVRTLMIGNLSSFENEEELRNLRNALIIGAILVIAYYHLTLFFLRRKDKASLVFSIFCLLIVFRSLLVERILWEILPQNFFFNYESLIRLEYLSGYIAAPLFMIFLMLVYPKEFQKRIVRVFILLGILFVAIVLLSHSYWFSLLTLTPYQLVIVAAFVYGIIGLVKAVRNKHPGAVVSLVGFALFFIIILNDLLYHQFILQLGSFIHLGLLVFIFSNSLNLSIHYTRSYNRAEKLSLELQSKNQELLKLDKIKDDFLAITSHELKTPLHGIIGITESLLKGIGGPLSEEQIKNLGLVQSSGHRLLNLVGDILDFSRLHNQSLRLTMTPVNGYSIVTMVTESLLPLVKRKNLYLVNTIKEDFPLIFADENRLFQILLNLIGNAIKFTTVGGISISAKVVKNKALIKITDTGIGISDDEINRIFQAFEQIETSLSRSQDGVGLGLAICKQLVELHGGTLDVKSSIDEGSEFFFTLPLYSEALHGAFETVGHGKSLYLQNTLNYVQSRIKVDGSASTSASIVSEEISVGEQNSQPLVMVVDDDEINCQVIHNYLSQNMNCEISVHRSGIDALECIKKLGPQRVIIMLLDIMMPGLSGYDVCREVRKEYPPNKLPVIFVTARNRMDDLILAFKNGGNDYLPKPFAQEELLMRIQLHLDLIQLRDQEDQMTHQLYQADRLITLGTSLSEVSHEIMNYNQVIKVNTSLLKQRHQYLKPILEDYLNNEGDFIVGSENYSEIKDDYDNLYERIIKNTSNIELLIHTIKTFARKESMQTEEIKIQDVLSEAIEICNLKAKKNRVFLNLVLKEPLKMIWGHFQFLAQAMINIINNSIEACDKEESHVNISVEEIDNKIRICVEDNGKGISIEDQAHIFQPFFTTKREKGGTGLGLSLVLKIIKSHEGSIQIISKPGLGTKVTILL